MNKPLKKQMEKPAKVPTKGHLRSRHWLSIPKNPEAGKELAKADKEAKSLEPKFRPLGPAMRLRARSQRRRSFKQIRDEVRKLVFRGPIKRNLIARFSSNRERNVSINSAFVSING